MNYEDNTIKRSNKKLTTQEVILQFQKVHGDLYDYSEVRYVRGKQKVRIICKEHGVFEQAPIKHKSGQGCNLCGNIKIGIKNGESLNSVLVKMKKVHGNKYDYSKVIYKNHIDKVKIICKEHGVFEQSINKHVTGEGCPKCSGQGLNTLDVIDQFKLQHGRVYDYSKVKYLGATKKVRIICKEHGEFKQSPSSHKNGQGCPKCVGRGETKVETIKRFEKIHGDKYDYSMVNFNSKDSKVKIICKEHGVFWQSVHKHLSGQGCSGCNVSGFDKTKPAIVYYFRIGELYKIGITNRSLKDRYTKPDLKRMSVLKIIKFNVGIDAENYERVIKRKYNTFKYKGPAVLKNGNTELFTVDVLQLEQS